MTRDKQGRFAVKEPALKVQDIATDADHEDADFQYVRGLRHLEGGEYWEDYPEAARCFRLAAEQGDMRSQTCLGKMYATGEGVTQDYAEAVKWFRLAADHRPYGDAEAQFELGMMCAEGHGWEGSGQSPMYRSPMYRWREALEWLSQAAATHERSGSSIERSGSSMQYLLRLCMCRPGGDQGKAKAIYNLGRMYFDDSPRCWTRGDSITAAVKCFRLAAELGHSAAQRRLGAMFVEGEHVLQDYVEALKWYHLAAEQGNVEAMFELGVLHDGVQGCSGIQDDAQIFKVGGVPKTEKWWNQAADLGHAEAQLELAKMYARRSAPYNQGLGQDYVLAHKWFNLAAKVADRDAVAAKMTPEQIVEAQRLAGEWRSTPKPSF
jgi:TPR repeat protein